MIADIFYHKTIWPRRKERRKNFGRSPAKRPCAATKRDFADSGTNRPRPKRLPSAREYWKIARIRANSAKKAGLTKAVCNCPDSPRENLRRTRESRPPTPRITPNNKSREQPKPRRPCAAHLNRRNGSRKDGDFASREFGKLRRK